MFVRRACVFLLIIQDCKKLSDQGGRPMLKACIIMALCVIEPNAPSMSIVVRMA